jgi:chemotaxis response regulator CheB
VELLDIGFVRPRQARTHLGGFPYQFNMNPPSKAVLARFADVRPIRSLKDLEKVKEERPDIILMDVCMARLDGKEALEVLRQSRPAPALVLIDAKMRPAALLKQLNSLGALKATRHSEPITLVTARTRLKSLFTTDPDPVQHWGRSS